MEVSGDFVIDYLLLTIDYCFDVNLRLMNLKKQSQFVRAAYSVPRMDSRLRGNDKQQIFSANRCKSVSDKKAI